MPYIDSITSLQLSPQNKENLKTKMGESMYQIPGKSEEWLFIRFQDSQTLYFKGKPQENAAIVEVKLLGSLEMSIKDNFTSLICNIFHEELQIPKENIYVIFYEISKGDWGWNGSLF
jgi:phenylpyruvate tautomerase PptA (4-oxalocrotonate tautomerase family)